MSSPSMQAAQRVLVAAQTLFARHGFSRTSMADIAAEAGVARATLYLRYADKRALFEALADALVTEALHAAEAAWLDGRSFAENLEATVLAKDLPLYRLLHATAHGAALLSVDADLTAQHARRLQDGFVSLLARRAAREAAEGADLSVFGDAQEFGAFLGTTCAGLKYEARDEGQYCAAVRRLCQVVARAAHPAPRAIKPPVAAAPGCPGRSA